MTHSERAQWAQAALKLEELRGMSMRLAGPHAETLFTKTTDLIELIDKEITHVPAAKIHPDW